MAQPDPGETFRAYAGVQRAADADILRILKDAQEDINAALKRLPLDQNRDVQRQRMLAIKREILTRQAEIYGKIGNVVEKRRLEAAVRALRQGAKYDQVLWDAIGRGEEGRVLSRNLEAESLRTMDAAIARVTGSAVPLSARVYRTEAFASGQLERRINSALARGLTAAEFAAEVRDFINPNTPGGQRYAALRLARTEINNAYHALSIEAARRKPWIEKMEWHLSNRHGRTDVCNTLAGQQFKVEDVPRKPHPQCLCYVTPIIDTSQQGTDDFLDQLVSGGLDDFLDQFGAQHGLAPAKKAAPVKRALKTVPAGPAATAPPVKKAAKKAPAKRAPAKKAQPAVPTTRIGSTDVPDIGHAPENKVVTRITKRIANERHRKRVQDTLNRQAVLTPGAIRTLGTVSVGAPTTGDRSNAEYHPGTRNIIINPRTMEYDLDYRPKAHRMGWFSDCGHDHGDAAGTVAHEYGHHVHYSMMRGFVDTRATSGLVSLIREHLGIDDLPGSFYHTDPDFNAWFKKHKLRIANMVSEYGATNLQEFCAEVWTEYSTNPNARPHIKAIGEYMQQQAELNVSR